MSKQSVITCIFAPTLHIEEIVLKCLRATEKEFAGDDLFAAIDAATHTVRDHCELQGWEIVELAEGHPPRMASLIRAALENVETEFVWTMEHDNLVLHGRRAAISDILTSHPDTAGVSCNPTGSVEIAMSAADRRLCEIEPPNYMSLNAVCWRTDALRQLNWTTIPQFPATDQAISGQLQSLGWRLLLSAHLTTVHLNAHARKELP